ncbi:uncharacterized protein N7482_003022 [Penicillium canariense]|uniref:NACHT domain-containing protein n=1 Tax=Penicillium canariense TaxID=189055 RepID=A0A9W9IK51_9EURO|nr:uncharacterized protein N7482_003022 [Penicillium canariense]KAJ5177145.1 hypothetical protein N7482_003022 [Penicillium canariense]
MFSKRFSLRKKSNDEVTQPDRNHNLTSAHPSLRDQIDDKGSIVAEDSLPVQKKGEPDSGPLGLNVVYTPENGHKADIVFVHGLGGSSRWTWSKSRNAELFWPLTFLPLEPDLCLARILSFGYNANFRKTGNASTVVLDFAKELLFDLKYAKDEEKKDLNIGAVPLLFVVHSMGGLIIKEAYMQGQNDPEYENIVKAISAILFLATPHRGTNLADILNQLLQSTHISTSKLYISELSKDSLTLQKLNEQFRHVAPRLDIVSFYETQPTSIGIKGARVMILEKDSSVLGYPGETSKALNADHHGVCKYDSPKDPNYITVRNVLKSIVSRIISTNRANHDLVSNQKGSTDLKTVLAIPEFPDVDYIFFQDQWTEGTNSWFVQEEAYSEWFDSQKPAPYLLWVNGGAATGKSVLSSFVINQLAEQDINCQYFFIRFSDRKKRSLSLLLRSIAYQIAQHMPNFRFKLGELADEGVDLETADPKNIWERIFKSILFKMEQNIPLYWIIDGLDEASDARATIKLFSEIGLSNVPIRILLFSRATSEIALGLRKVPRSVRQGNISVEGHMEDLYAHMQQELSMSGSTDFKDNIVQRIVEGSQNNFLWVRLVVEKLNACHTLGEVERVLQELPSGMEALYDRMALSIAENPSPSARALASTILQCVACSFRTLTVAELSQALGDDRLGMLDFQQSVTDLCGGFVVVDNSGNVTMIHHSAREYLLSEQDRPFSINQAVAHEKLFLGCMRCLMATGLRAKVSRNDKPEFLDYSAMWWPSHLTPISPMRESTFKVLKRFLTSHWVLTWMHALVMTKQLRILIRASKHLSNCSLSRNNALDSAPSGIDYIMEQQLLETWATDFMKIVGRFGTILRRNPEAIYKAIPPFCPQNSAIYQQFGKSEGKSLAVQGISMLDWDDSVARLSFGTFAASISAAGTYIGVLLSSGNVLVYDSSEFEETTNSPIRHGERVYRMAFNRTGTMVVTYGFKTTNVWESSTGRCKASVQNPKSRPQPLAILFTNNDQSLLVATDDRQVRSFNINDPPPTWRLVAELEEPEIEGHFLNSSSYMALNEEESLIAVAYRGHPLSAWEVDGPVHINHCWRAREEVARGEVIEAVWHPHSPEILGLYIEGVAFKWNPYEGNPEEVGTGASKLAISKDGSLFATGDVQGTIKVYATSDFRLLYQLASQDPILGLEFSSSLHRFYDFRGPYGNAWEPNALMRYAERLEKGPDSDNETDSLGQSNTLCTVSSKRVDPITVLAASPLGRFCCCGTEHGVVKLFDIQHGKVSDIHDSKGFLSIEQMIWSHNGQFICFSDSSKNIFIASMSTTDTESNRLTVETMTKVSMKSSTTGPITQLLFHPDSSHVLLSTSTTVFLLAIPSGSVKHSLDLSFDVCKWVFHPHDQSIILGFGPRSITKCDWTLTEINIFRYDGY